MCSRSSTDRNKIGTMSMQYYLYLHVYLCFYYDYYHYYYYYHHYYCCHYYYQVKQLTAQQLKMKLRREECSWPNSCAPKKLN